MGRLSPFPAGVAGEHLDWYFTTRERGSAEPEEVEAHFAPSYRWGWGSPREPSALEAWFSRWRTLSARIEGVETLGPLEFVVTSRLDSGVVARVWFELEPSAPHRILRTRTTEHDGNQPAVDFGEAVAFDARGEGCIPSAYTTAAGPFGGYVAAQALSAVGAAGSKPLPLTLSGHFVTVGASGPVTASVEVLRSSSRLESTAVRLMQGVRLLFSGHVWSAAEATLERRHAAVPSVLLAAASGGPPERGVSQGVLGASLEAQWLPIEGYDASAWVRLRPRSLFDSAWTDAGRLLLSIDWLGVIAGVRPYRTNEGMVVGSTLELSASFLGHDRATEWVLCAARAAAADGPWATVDVSVISEAGHPLATASLRLLLRG
ncbi:MAG TPA: thioesterase family protein [Acidimicrobiales bacterium]|nr:thioesterase family protein [Acidimicrobiales bacterium]